MAEPPRALRALFPGTFDPFTRGHQDLVARARALFGRVTVGVARNPEKQAMFSAEERAELVRGAVCGLSGVDVVLVPGLVVAACEELGCDVLVRGVRGGADFESEVQMARTNRALLPRIDTVLLAPAPEFAHVSSTLVRQVASLGGDASAFVPANVAAALRAPIPCPASLRSIRPMPDRKRVATPSSKPAPAAIGPYSQAIAAGGLLHCSGQIALDPASGELVQGDVGAQTERVLENLTAVLAAAGTDPSRVLKCTVYLKNISDFAAMNAVYARYFPGDAPPARSTVGVAELPRGALVEIDCLALL